jgi:hypothetical protein
MVWRQKWDCCKKWPTCDIACPANDFFMCKSNISQTGTVLYAVGAYSSMSSRDGKQADLTYASSCTGTIGTITGSCVISARHSCCACHELGGQATPTTTTTIYSRLGGYCMYLNFSLVPAWAGKLPNKHIHKKGCAGLGGSCAGHFFFQVL